ncbi:MAG: sigma-70 family RNA polymerase sigma factor [Planctomycetota bacterium]|nr:sigma-70 family RNA polymerase sigma factor [Planctomycetota bacterium]
MVDLLARRERGRLISGLVRRLGNHNLELAEDVAQESLLSALSIWPYQGVPDNPAAWLTKVAGNKAIDRLRRERGQSIDHPEAIAQSSTSDGHFEPDCIVDPELQLIFLCCHASLDEYDRLALTLRVVAGFTSREIADLLLCKETAVAQRLSRCKRRLREQGPELSHTLTSFEIEDRIETVLKVIYLAFSRGYSPRRGTRLIRRDIAHEALRLAHHLADNTMTATPATQALAALLCFHASRFDAREDADGRPVLMRDQHRENWNAQLIDSGLRYLRKAMAGQKLSRYHVEAGIASCYAIAPSWDQVDWQSILVGFDRLQAIVDSPVVLINRCVALAFSGDPANALSQLLSLCEDTVVSGYAPFHIASAEIFRLLGRLDESRVSYLAAIDCGASTPVIQHIESRLMSLL